MNKHPRPDNLEKIKVPATNNSIWEKLRAGDKALDLKTRKIQKLIIASTVAASRVLDKSQDREVSKNMEYIVRFLGQAHIQLNEVRKDCHKRVLPENLKKVAFETKNEGDEENLYGNETDLKKLIKDLGKETKQKPKKSFLEKRRKEVPYNRRNQNFRPFFQNQNQSQRRPFFKNQTRRSPNKTFRKKQN